MSDYLPGRNTADNLPSFNTPQTWGGPGPVDFDFHALAKQLDCTRNFNQVGIIYSNGVSQWLVRPSRRIANPAQSTVTHVIVTKVSNTSPQAAAQATSKVIQAPSLTTEITSTAMSCGAMVATVVLAMTSTFFIPFTAAATGYIAGVMIAGSIATGAQCFIGAGRLFLINQGNEDNVAWLDSQGWYTATVTALDLISLAGAGAGLKKTLDLYLIMKSSSSAKAIEWLKGLSRPERKRITIEIIRARNPGISNEGVKALIKAGAYPTRYPAEALQKSLQYELMKAVTDSSAFAGSAFSGTLRNPQNVQKSGQYVFGLIQSFSV